MSLEPSPRLPQVCSLPHPVFKVTATQLVTHENVKKSLGDLRSGWGGTSQDLILWGFAFFLLAFGVLILQIIYRGIFVLLIVLSL